MRKPSVRILSLLLAFAFVTGQVQPVYAFENLAASLVSDPDINPGRSNPVGNDIGHKLKPGSIANGVPLLDLIRGNLPERIELNEEDPGIAAVIQKVRDAANLAIAMHIEDEPNILLKHQGRVEQTLENLFTFWGNTNDRLYLFNAVVAGPEDYLLGFNLPDPHSNEVTAVGLAIELVERLSRKRLAQYIYHECVPEYRKDAPGEYEIDREDHRVIYREIQASIFEMEEVTALGRDFREFIDEKAAISDETPPMGGGLDAEELRRVAQKAPVEKLVNYIRKTGLFSQVGVIREALKEDPAKLEEFNRLLTRILPPKAVPDARPPEERFKLFYSVAWKQEKAGNRDGAIEMLEKARIAVRQIKEKLRFRINALIDIGSSLAQMGDKEGAREAFKEVKIITGEEDNVLWKSTAFAEIAVGEAKSGLFEDARITARTIEDDGDREGTLRYIDRIQKEAGTTAKDDKTPPMGGGLDAEMLRRFAREATAERLVEYIRKSGLFSQVEMIREALKGNPAKLKEFNRLVARILPPEAVSDARPPEERFKLFYNVAWEKEKTGDREGATEMLKKARTVVQQIKGKPGFKIDAFIVIGSSLAQMEDKEGARETFKEAKNTAWEEDSLSLGSTAFVDIAKAEAESGLFSDARTTAIQLIDDEGKRGETLSQINRARKEAETTDEDNETPPMGGGLDAEELREFAREATAEELAEYIRTTGLFNQVAVIKEALKENIAKLEEFKRLLAETVPWKAAPESKLEDRSTLSYYNGPREQELRFSYNEAWKQERTGNRASATEMLEKARTAALKIEGKLRFRINALIDIGWSLAQIEDEEGARETFMEAKIIVWEEVIPFWRSTAFAEIAQGEAESGLFEDARTTAAQLIDDEGKQEETLRQIARRQNEAGLSEDTEATHEAVENMTDLGIMYRAELFKHNLTRLAKYRDLTFVLAIDSDIGRDQHSQIMEIYRVVDRLRRLKDADGRPLFPNLRIIRREGSTGELTQEIEDLLDDEEENVMAADVFMVVQEDNLQQNKFEALEGLAWIASIDDSYTQAGLGNYLPVFEAATLAVMAALDADVKSIKEFYDMISEEPVDPEELEFMLESRIIYILPRMNPVDLDRELRDIYERVAKIYMAV